MILSSYYFSFALSFSDICLCRPVVALDMCICTERTCTECRYVKMGSLEPTKTYAWQMIHRRGNALLLLCSLSCYLTK